MRSESKPTMHLRGGHPAVATAAGELNGVLATAAGGKLGAATIHLGLFEELPKRGDLIRRGLVNLHNVTPGQDAFECLCDGDDATHLWGLDLQDFPLGVGAKIARWHDLEVDGVFDHWGTCNETVSSNSVACREFFLNPLADPETVCRRIALNQHGPAAGETAFRAWQEIERAQRILSNCTVWAPSQWPGWYAGKGNAPLPEFLARQSAGLDASRLVAKEALGFTYNSGDLADCLDAVGVGWRLAAPHFAEAARLLGEAAAAADDAPVGYAFGWNGGAAPLSRREHLGRHRIYAEYLGLLGREIGLHFELHALFERSGRNPGAYLAAAADLLRQDGDACTAIVAFCERFVREHPAAAAQSARWGTEYRRKIEQLESIERKTQ